MKSTTRITAALGGLAFLIGSVGVLRAAGDGSTSAAYRPTKQAFQSISIPESTSSQAFTELVGLSRVAILNRGPVTVTVSGDFVGAPAELRAREGERALKPGVARVNPASEQSFTFTFVTRTGEARCRYVDIDWRSPSGDSVTLNHGVIVVDYHFDDTDGKVRLGCA